jgi:GMP synthase-like glutamine amidotransferase
MKILLVNNHTRHTQKLAVALMGHEVEAQLYHPGVNFHADDKDLVILSGGGGEGMEIHDRHTPEQLWYEDEMRFIMECNKPIIGICMGFELIASVYGGQIEKLPYEIDQYLTLKTTPLGKKLLKSNKITQYEGHEWAVKSVPKKHFDVLAKSKTGVEVIRHKTRPIFATQFHPEFPDGTIHLFQLLKGAES